MSGWHHLTSIASGNVWECTHSIPGISQALSPVASQNLRNASILKRREVKHREFKELTQSCRFTTDKAGIKS